MTVPVAPKTAGVAAVVLAAGRSQRMGARNKLLVELDGKPMIARVVDAVLASRAAAVIVVTGYEAAAVRRVLEGRDVAFVHAEDFADGMGRSIGCGMAAVPDEAAGCAVCLGDMPLVEAEVLDHLIERFEAEGGTCIVAPVSDGARGNPVLWPRAFFSDLLALEGDAGGRHLLSEHADQVVTLPVDGAGVLVDVDTADDLEGLKNFD